MIRILVLVAVFFSGAALMSLEMAGFRLVQPEFGSNIVVWGSLISVFLGGLALGAFLGGRWADYRPALWKLGVILACGGAVALAIPAYSDAVLDWTFPGEGAPLPTEWNAGGEGARAAEGASASTCRRTCGGRPFGPGSFFFLCRRCSWAWCRRMRQNC